MAYKAGWDQVLRPSLTIVGLEARTNNKDEMDPATSRIGPLWRRFLTSNPLGKVADRKSPGTTIAAYTSYASDHRGDYTIVVGEEIVDAPREPAKARDHLMKQMERFAGKASVLEPFTGELVKLTVLEAFYLRFTAKGEMPAALMKTWGEIWAHFDENPTPKRAYTADYEVHNREGGVDVYVAVATSDAANRTLPNRSLQ